MHKILTILKREYKESVFKKGFIIATILTPVIMMALVFVPALISQIDVEKSIELHVIDFSGIVFNNLEQKLDDRLSNGDQRYFLKKIESTPDDFRQQKSELTNLVNNESIYGFILVPSEVIDSSMVEFYARNVGNFDLNNRIRQAINEVVVDYRIMQSGMDPELIGELTKRIQLKTFKIKKGEAVKEGNFVQEYFGSLFFVMILYMTIIIYGTSIMRSVIQEKNSRIIEVLLSSANSFQLMAGKIVGVGSVGLTQYLIWSVFGILLATQGASMVSGEWISFTPALFIYFVLFFVLGYFLFATIYAGIGSLTNSDQEAQQLSMPVVFLLVTPLLLMSFIIKNPDSSIAVIISLIPFFSPMLMFLRINISAPPLWEIWTSIIVLILTITFMIWIAAKVYRVGILMYGKRPNLPEIIRWIKAK